MTSFKDVQVGAGKHKPTFCTWKICTPSPMRRRGERIEWVKHNSYKKSKRSLNELKWSQQMRAGGVPRRYGDRFGLMSGPLECEIPLLYSKFMSVTQKHQEFTGDFLCTHGFDADYTFCQWVAVLWDGMNIWQDLWFYTVTLLMMLFAMKI